MAIPDYQSVMLPFLKFVSDEIEHSLREIVENLAQSFNLSEEERRELLPSGQMSIFYSRVGWARTYLKKAGLIESPKRGVLKITQRGLEALRQNPQHINDEFLKQYPEFIEFISTSRTDDAKTTRIETKIISQQTPEESLEYDYQKIRQNLADELLNRVKTCSPSFFERLVVELLVKMGYGGSIKDAGKAVGKSGDGGIDGIIKEDKLGLDVIYIQAKRWEGTVGRPEIMKFVGALQGQRAKKGVFITTSSFSNEAIEYMSKIDNKIILIDGGQLSQLMIDYDIGVSKIVSYEIKRIDSDYFTEDE
ncbi:MAG: restriction endonuclease [Deltaproteobacteria bacterium]|nr:restriction endonuclease [Deltaproteobacteria bacterium]